MSLLACLLLVAAKGPQAGASASAKPYDLMVMVMGAGPGPAQVVVSYPAVIDHAALQSGIEHLGKSAGFTPSKLAIRDAPLAKQVPTQGTDAQFDAPGLINSSGRLPVGPIARSLPQWEHMRLVFILDPGFPFTGPTDVTVEGLAVRLVNQVETFEYDVERISGDAAPSGGAQAVSGSGRAGPGEKAKRYRRSWRSGFAHQVLPAALIGLPSGLLAGWVLSGWRERKRRRRAAAARSLGAQPKAPEGKPETTGPRASSR